jgi:hypothetical protein
MTRKTRTILFLLCSSLLLFTAPTIILYSQGYRFDFEAKKIVQTGGFYAKTLPKSAEIYINEKLRKKTDFLFGTALIKNLLPKNYEIEIKKQGYYPWKKSLEIKEKQVTEAKNVVLISKNPDFTLSDKNIKDFWFSPNLQKIILKKENEKGWVLDIFDVKQETRTLLISENELLGADISDLAWSQDSNKVLLKTLNSFFVLELTNPFVIFPLDFLGKNVKEISFDPNNTKKIFSIGSSTTTNSLLQTDYRKKEISNVILTNLITYKNSGENIYWLSDKGFLYQSNFKGKILEVLNSKPLSLKPEANYEIYNNAGKIFLKENNSLYLLNEKKNFEKIYWAIKDFKFSSDNKKIAYFSNSEIWIFFLEQEYGQPQKQRGEKVFLTRFSEKIDDCFWFTNHYLVFNVKDQIKIAEIDDRDRINIVELAEFKNPQLFFNQNDKKLYILSQRNFYVSEKLY